MNVAYTLRALASQHGHLFFLDFGAVKGLRVSLSCTTDCGIRHDFIASAQPVRVARSPKGVPIRSIRISFDGRTLRRSGAAFVWVLDRELR